MPKFNRNGQAAILSKKDFLKIRRALKKKSHRLMLDIAIYTGERWGAICQLQVEDVYKNPKKSTPHKYITFRSKTRKASPDGRKITRQVPIHEDLITILKAYKPPIQEWLFPGNNGNHFSLRGADNFLRKAVIEARLESKGISTHSTRRSFITSLNKKGISLPVIKQITGHQDTKTLTKYIEVSPKQIKRAINSIMN